MRSRFDGIEGMGNYGGGGMGGLFDDVVDVAEVTLPGGSLLAAYDYLTTGGGAPLTQTAPASPDPGNAPINAEIGGQSGGGALPSSSGGYTPLPAPRAPAAAPAQEAPSEGIPTAVYVVGGLVLLAAGWFFLKD